MPPVSRVSSTNAPSRIEISRSAVAAIRSSWVTTTSVRPRRAGPRRAGAPPRWRRCRGCRSARRRGRRAARWRAPGRWPPAGADHRRAPRGGDRRGRRARPVRAAAGTAARLSRRAPGEQGRQLDVLLGRQLVHEVERLEDEADLVSAELGEGPLGELVDAPPVQPQLAGGRSVEPAEEMEQRRLAAAARPHHRQRLATCDVEVDLVDGADEPLAAAVLLAQSSARTIVVSAGSSLSPPIRPVAFAGLQPAQVGLEAKHDAFEQQRGDRSGRARPSPRAGRRAAAAAAHGAACRRCRSGRRAPPAAAAMSFRWNSARSGFGQLTSLSHSATRSSPAGVRT